MKLLYLVAGISIICIAFDNLKTGSLLTSIWFLTLGIINLKFFIERLKND